MSPTRASGGRLLVALAAVAALVMIFLPATPAQADIDLTGTWKFSFVAPIIGVECPDAQVVQTGSDVDIDCSAFVSTFDKSTRVLSGGFCPGFLIGCVSFAGTVSSDGNSVSGVWRHSGIPTEFSFSGVRKPPVGGIALDPDVRAVPLESGDGHGHGASAFQPVAAITGMVTLAGGAWFARRRLVR